MSRMHFVDVVANPDRASQFWAVAVNFWGDEKKSERKGGFARRTGYRPSKIRVSWTTAQTDEQAMWRVQMHHDTGAFSELVRRWEVPLRRLAVRMLGDVHRAEDVAQEAFARVFTHRREFEPGSRFSTWVWRIAVNLCCDELRRRERRHERPLDLGEDGVGSPETTEMAPNPAEAAEAGERAELVRRMLMRLPEAYRVVVALRHYEGLKFQEIAQVLELPEGTVKSRMSEALDRMEVLLRPWKEGLGVTEKETRR